MLTRMLLCFLRNVYSDPRTWIHLRKRVAAEIWGNHGTVRGSLFEMYSCVWNVFMSLKCIHVFEMRTVMHAHGYISKNKSIRNHERNKSVPNSARTRAKFLMIKKIYIHITHALIYWHYKDVLRPKIRRGNEWLLEGKRKKKGGRQGCTSVVSSSKCVTDLFMNYMNKSDTHVV